MQTWKKVFFGLENFSYSLNARRLPLLMKAVLPYPPWHIQATENSFYITKIYTLYYIYFSNDVWQHFLRFEEGLFQTFLCSFTGGGGTKTQSRH